MCGEVLAGYPSHIPMTPQSIQMPFYHPHFFQPFATLKVVEAVDEGGKQAAEGVLLFEFLRGNHANLNTRICITSHPPFNPPQKNAPVQYVGSVYGPTLWSEPMVRSHDEGPVLRLFHHQPLCLPTGTWGHWTGARREAKGAELRE